MYQVRFYKGNYSSRQRQANADNCVAYVEHHFNSSSNPGVNYSIVITGYNASETSKSWGRWYAQEIARRFQTRIAGYEGILVGGYNGRGNGNLKRTKMPAILLEPLFASNPEAADIIRSEAGQIELALILSESIRKFFPNGGTVGFSVGHKYKTSRPNDRGAALYGGGWEANYAEQVMLKAKDLLENYTPEEAEDKLQAVRAEQKTKREIRVVQNNQIIWRHVIDEGEDISWNAENNELNVKLITDEDDDISFEEGVLTLTIANLT